MVEGTIYLFLITFPEQLKYLLPFPYHFAGIKSRKFYRILSATTHSPRVFPFVSEI